MQRYFIEDLNIKKQTATILGADFHNIKTDMSSTTGSEIIVCQDGVCYQALIKEFLTDGVLCSLQKELPTPIKEFNVTIAQGLIRSDSFEYMLQKSTELGVDTIIPMVSQHSIVNINPQNIHSKVEIWNNITKKTSELSQRNLKSIVTSIEDIRSIKYNQYDVVLVAYEKENLSHNLKHILQTKFKSILVLIGPEGGLSDMEIQFLSGFSNAEFVGFGQRILQSETASSYILSVLNYEYEMLI